MKLLLPWLAALVVSGCTTQPGSQPAPEAQDEYTEDLRTMCRVYKLTGKSADDGFGMVADWLLDHLRTKEALHRLAQLPKGDVVGWMRQLRSDAAARGISPCHLADATEALLKEQDFAAPEAGAP